MSAPRTALFALSLLSLAACAPQSGTFAEARSSSLDTPELEAGSSEAGPSMMDAQDAAPIFEAAVDLEDGDGVDFQRRDISVDVVQVLDSRCPAGARCAWAGTIAAQLDVRVRDTKSTVTLAVDQPAYVEGVRFEVLGSRPYPGFRVKGEPQVLSLLVSEYELAAPPTRTPKTPRVLFPWPGQEPVRGTVVAAEAAPKPGDNPVDLPVERPDRRGDLE